MTGMPAPEMSPPPPDGTRRALSEADLPALCALIGRCLAADGGLPDGASEQFVRRQFLSGHGVGLFGAGHGGLIAAAAVGDARDGKVSAAGAVDPAFRGQGIGRQLLDWTLAAASGLPLLISTETLSEPAERLYARYGLRQVFAELVLRADLAGPDPAATGSGLARVDVGEFVVPDGIELRPWASGLEPAFFAAYSAAFRDRPGFPGRTQQEWLDWTSQDEDFRPDLSMLAVGPSGEPAGFVTVGSNWIVQTGVVPQWRRRGLGTGLVRSAMAGIGAAGFGSCWLTVATNNPGAAALYRQLGFAVAGRRARYAS
jgi:mycothiol synthase